MQYRIYKLKFHTPVHFGSERKGTSLENVNATCHSDTLFSAVCNEYVKLYDELELDDYKDLFEDGKILISSMFPYNKYDMFLPKPSVIVERDTTKETEYSDKKKMKKLEFIKVSDFSRYLECLKTGKPFEFDESEYEFAKYSDNAKVALRTGEDENKLYRVGAYTFEEDAGLYFIAGFEDNSETDEFDKIIESLGYSGIGGKRTSGYGKFEVDDVIESSENLLPSEKILFDLLKTNGKYSMLLSLVSPGEEESDNDFSNCYYNLIKRNGYIYSTDYADTLLKRKNLVMFREGSCFDVELSGTIQEVGESDGKHPVYRYGKALKIGVEV